MNENEEKKNKVEEKVEQSKYTDQEKVQDSDDPFSSEKGKTEAVDERMSPENENSSQSEESEDSIFKEWVNKGKEVAADKTYV